MTKPDEHEPPGRLPDDSRPLFVVLLVSGGLLVILALIVLTVFVIVPTWSVRGRDGGAARGEDPEERQRRRCEQARMEIKLLETAADAYFVQHGQYPDRLEILCRPDEKGNPPHLEVKALIDPWTRPYVYEPQTLHPATGRPKIYSRGPNPADRGGVIANWDE